MTASTLRQVLAAFERADAPLALTQIAHDLDLPLERLEGMVEYWVRRGRIRESGTTAAPLSCAKYGSRPYVLRLPRILELVPHGEPESAGEPPAAGEFGGTCCPSACPRC
jgi:hypothetical protein